MRAQTLGRTLFGLMEMREALVDVVYLELKSLCGHTYLDIDYHGPTSRSVADDVVAWMQRNRYPLFRHSTLQSRLQRGKSFVRRNRMKSVCGEVPLLPSFQPLYHPSPAQGSFQDHLGGWSPTPPPPQPPLDPPRPLKDWAKFSSGLRPTNRPTNQKISLAPSAPNSLDQKFSSAPQETQHNWGLGVEGVGPTHPPASPASRYLAPHAPQPIPEPDASASGGWPWACGACAAPQHAHADGPACP